MNRLWCQSNSFSSLLLFQHSLYIFIINMKKGETMHVTQCKTRKISSNAFREDRHHLPRINIIITDLSKSSDTKVFSKHILANLYRCLIHASGSILIYMCVVQICQAPYPIGKLSKVDVSSTSLSSGVNDGLMFDACLLLLPPSRRGYTRNTTAQVARPLLPTQRKLQKQLKMQIEVSKNTGSITAIMRWTRI